MGIESSLDIIRESFGRVVYTHKAHEKMIDLLNARKAAIKWLNLTALVLTTGGIITPILDQFPYREVMLSFTSAFALGVAIYQISFDPDEKIRAHRKCAKQLWFIRESYISLIADIQDSLITEHEAKAVRDALCSQLSHIYREAPDTNSKAYEKARKALKINEEMTFSSDEIDEFLPSSFRGRSSHQKVI
jgi:hypothetical protein